jgi:mRNA interferase MazF
MKRGDLFWVNLDPTIGSEIRKKRPCVLVGANPINKARRTVVVVPLSTAADARPPLTIQVEAFGRRAIAVCDQIRAVDKSWENHHHSYLTDKPFQRGYSSWVTVYKMLFLY